VGVGNYVGSVETAASDSDVDLENTVAASDGQENNEAGVKEGGQSVTAKG
jgi:hypothetical protein